MNVLQILSTAMFLDKLQLTTPLHVAWASTFEYEILSSTLHDLRFFLFLLSFYILPKQAINQPTYWHFYVNPDFIRTPLKLLRPPCYIEAFALVESKNPSLSLRKRCRCNSNILKYNNKVGLANNGSVNL